MCEHRVYFVPYEDKNIHIYICMYACVSIYAHTERYKYEICVYMYNIYVMHIYKLRGRKDKSLASHTKKIIKISNDEIPNPFG